MEGPGVLVVADHTGELTETPMPVSPMDDAESFELDPLENRAPVEGSQCGADMLEFLYP